MVKKISLTLTTPDPPIALLAFAATLEERALPATWDDPARRVLVWRDQVAVQARQLQELTAAWKQRRDLRIKSNPATEDEENPLHHLLVDLDLEVLFGRRDAEALAGQALAILRAVDGAGWFLVEGRLGRARVARLTPVIEALVKAASHHGIFLDPERQVNARFDDEAEEEAPRPPPSAAPPPPPPSEAEPSAKSEKSAGKSRSRKKTHRAKQGSFGGLPDEEPPSVAAPTGKLGEEELFFLSYARLEWPCEASRIKVAHRQVVKAAHPDKHVGDPAAHHRFLLLQRGYEGLLLRLGA